MCSRPIKVDQNSTLDRPIYCLSFLGFINSPQSHILNHQSFRSFQSSLSFAINNISVPKLIFGAALFGVNFANPEDVQEVLDYLKENNITHLDTAGRYPPTLPGRSEELIGETDAASQGFTIDTKILALAPDQRGGIERSAVEQSLKTSLQRLGVEQVVSSYWKFICIATIFHVGEYSPHPLARPRDPVERTSRDSG